VGWGLDNGIGWDKRKTGEDVMLNLSHKNLEVYRLSLQLMEETYKITKSFPKDEQYILVSQLRRAAISVCSNIAEGASRISKREKKRFYEIARGSIVEIDTQLEISCILKYSEKEKQVLILSIIASLFKMLSKMILNLNTPINNLNT
jgi:four helix bundle protein